MEPQPITLEPIGIIHSPFHTLDNMPIQPAGAPDATGTVELLPHLAPALKDLDGFSHIYLLYHFHLAGPAKLLVTPFLDTVPRGLFATRAPLRPCPIGLSLVELVAIDQHRLTVRGIDVLDNTPLLDIKPYIERFDHPPNSRAGWMTADHDHIARRRSDQRFT